MKIPFLDLARLHASIRPELDAAFDEVIGSSAFIGGAGPAFETSFGALHGMGPGAGCGSGTDALVLSLRALGVGAGDEVIVPSMTFIATAEAVVHVGATPVVADVDADTLLLDEASVDAVRTDRSRAVIPVHLYGHVVPFATLQRWRADGLFVIEDAAQAHIASDGGALVGSAGNVACFSFYPGKNLGALGDAGMVLSGDEALLAEVRRLRDHGRTSKYEHDVVGWCSRMDGLQAALLDVKARHLTAWTTARRALASRYRDRIGDLLVPWTEGAVHHLLVARVADRDNVQRALRSAGIGTGIHYPVPLSQQPWLVAAGAGSTPHAEKAATEILSLPLDPLMSGEQVDEVCDHLVRAIG